MAAGLYRIRGRRDEPYPYGELIARWEWPPWLKLTAYTRDVIETADQVLELYPSVVRERDCRAFDTGASE